MSLNMIVIHCALKCYHNFDYYKTGVGSIQSEIWAHVLLTFSRITMVTVLIAFSFGWQVIYDHTKDIKKYLRFAYFFALIIAFYDDFALSSWIKEHPSDLFHLVQSNI
jgi:hypothetical protein